MSAASTDDAAGRMAAMASELPNGLFGDEPADPSSGQGGTAPRSGVLREDEPDVENGLPSGDDTELGDRS